jgi:GNAT superfamily N-acetyltransferase
MAMEHLTADLTMAQETLAECLDDHAKTFLALHWAEISTTPDIPLNPDYAQYERLEADGVLRCYILRDQGVLQGYAVFMLTQSLKYQTLDAMCDLLYVAPRYRHGLIGGRFMGWCDEQLAKEGVQLVRHCVQRTYAYDATLLRLGYEPVPEQVVYLKRLGPST